MKVKQGYMLRKIAGSHVIVPFGERVVEFSGIITINESGALLWDMLSDNAEMDRLVSAVISEYDIDESTATKDVAEFIDTLVTKGLVEV